MDTNKVTNKVAEYTFEAPTKAVYRGNNSIDGKTVTAGETLQYRITVKNPTGKALDFNITDKVDANLVFLRASDGGSHKNGTITWKVEVPANGSKTVTFDAVVGGSVPAGTVIQNTATMSVRNEKRDSNTVSNTVVLPPVPAAQTPATPASVVAHAVKYVKTGDNGIIILFAGLGIALLGGLGVYISKAKKKEE